MSYKNEFQRLITLKRDNEHFNMIGYLNVTYQGKKALTVLMDMLHEHLFDGCDETTYVYHDSDCYEFHIDGFTVTLQVPDDLQGWHEIGLEDILSTVTSDLITFEG